MSDLQNLLNSFAAQIQLVSGGGSGPGSLITAALNPDPLQTGLIGGPLGLTRTNVLLKLLRFGDATLPDSGTSIAQFLQIAGQVLGGQAMPTVSVELPGPALPGARIPVTTLSGGASGVSVNPLNGLTIAQDVPPPASGLAPQPSLGQDPGTPSANDVLSGVPGIVGVIESGLTQPLPLSVSLTWTFTVTAGPPGIPLPTPATVMNNLSSISVIPPVIFTDLTTSGLFTLQIGVTGTVTIPGMASITPVNISPAPISVQFPGIPVPRLLALFTWPLYGSQPAVGRSDPNQDSLLIMLPADSPLTDKTSIASAISSVQGAVGPVLSLVSGALAAGTVAPFASPASTVTLLTALLAGLNAPGGLLSAAASGGYTPLTIAKATGAVRGGLSDITNLWWHSYFPGGHDYYHDNAQSFLWLAPPTGSVTLFRDTRFSSDPSDPNDHGKMTLTTGATCLAGIPDFRPSPSVLDTTLSPTSLTPNAGAALTGFFTNEHPPTSENDWAWTDSFLFA